MFKEDISNLSDEELKERCSHCLENTGDECQWLETKSTNMIPIYVPSKGRANTSKLLKNNEGLAIIVEPSEQHTYKMMFPQHIILVLPENNRGITYVRNFIKAITEAAEISAYWQLDDDISDFFRREDKKMIKCPMQEALSYAESQFKNNNTDLGALEYQQIAWSATKDIHHNGYCDVAVYVNNVNSEGMRYRSYVEGKEDRDFAMQFIKRELNVTRVTKYAFGAPGNGSNKGGLKETFYDVEGREKLCADRMVETWGEDICQHITKKDGRQDVKIHWNRITSKQSSLF